ncbi:MAG TPA: peptidase inhibitor family I36 protein [Bryobacteraceae bacterium]|nr:peptidase inhibitor family I36 protein [Bryobacteraceae bacterium]
MKKMIAAFIPLWFGLALVGQNPWTYRDHPNWDASWNRRPLPRQGACFFTDRDFRGNRFCVSRGDRLDRLPGNFGDNISSIQLFGRTRVIVYNDRNFRGGNREFRTSIADLRTQPFRGGHTWNNRISSIVVR